MTIASEQLQHLDEIAREAHSGNYARVGVLSTGERLYVALASGRMRELATADSIAYAVDRVGPAWMGHMLEEWRNARQPEDDGVQQLAAPHVSKDSHECPIPAGAENLANRGLFTAAAVRSLYLHTLPGGYFAVYKKDGSAVEPVGAWMTWTEVAQLCGASKHVTLRDALERDGFTWPAVPDQFLIDFYNL